MNFKNIKLLSATNGVFTQKTAEKIIPVLNLSSDVLDNIDLKYNYLTDLNFIDFEHRINKGN